MSEEERLRKQRKPSIHELQVKSLASKFWGLDVVDLHPLDSYDDCNHYLLANDKKFILKVYNGAESPFTLEGFAYLFHWLERQKSHYLFPTIQSSLNNNSIEFISSESNEYSYGVRLFHWIPGRTLRDIDKSSELYHFQQIGQMLAHLTIALQGFHHDSFSRIHAWDLKQFDTVLSFVSSVPEHDIRSIIEEIHLAYRQRLLPSTTALRWSCIHGDPNDANIIINDKDQVVGLIDFGDAVYTWTVNDIASAMCYALLTSYGKEHPEEVLLAVFGSYHAVYRLTDVELKFVKILIAMRLSLSIAIGAYSIAQSPKDAYLTLHAIPAKDALRFVWNLPNDFFTRL